MKRVGRNGKYRRFFHEKLGCYDTDSFLAKHILKTLPSLKGFSIGFSDELLNPLSFHYFEFNVQGQR